MVQLGRDLNEIRDSNNRNYYVDYNKLKAAIDSLFQGNDYEISREKADTARDHFSELLDYELEKCNRFVEVESQTWLQQLRSCDTLMLGYRNLEQYVEPRSMITAAPDDAEEKEMEVESKLEGLREQLLNLEKYRRVNYTAFQKITKKFDKAHKRWVGGGVLQQFSSEFMAHVERASFLRSNTDWLVACYSMKRKELRSLYVRRPALFPTHTARCEFAQGLKKEPIVSLKTDVPGPKGTSSQAAPGTAASLKADGAASGKKGSVRERVGLDGLIDSQRNDLDDEKVGRQRYFVDNVRRLSLLLALVHRFHFDENSQGDSQGVAQAYAQAYAELCKLLEDPTKSVPQKRCGLWAAYHYEAISQSSGTIVQWNSCDLKDVQFITVCSRKTDDNIISALSAVSSSSPKRVLPKRKRKNVEPEKPTGRIDEYISPGARLLIEASGSSTPLAVFEAARHGEGSDNEGSDTGSIQEGSSDSVHQQLSSSGEKEHLRRLNESSTPERGSERHRVAFQAFLASDLAKEKWHFCRSERLRLRADDGEVVILDERMSLSEMAGPGHTFTSLVAPANVTRSLGASQSSQLSYRLSDIFRYEVRRGVVDLRETDEWVIELASTYGLTSISRYTSLIQLACERDLLRNEAKETTEKTETTESKDYPQIDKADEVGIKSPASKSPTRAEASNSGKRLRSNKGSSVKTSASVEPKTSNNDILAMKRAGALGSSLGFSHLKYGHEDMQYITALSRQKPREDHLLDPFVAFHDNVELKDKIDESVGQSGSIREDGRHQQPQHQLAADEDSRPRAKIVKNVQPKTYLANERTFIQWLEISVLIFLFGCAGILLGTATAMGKAQEKQKTPIPSPAVMMAAAHPTKAAENAQVDPMADSGVTNIIVASGDVERPTTTSERERPTTNVVDGQSYYYRSTASDEVPGRKPIAVGSSYDPIVSSEVVPNGPTIDKIAAEEDPFGAYGMREGNNLKNTWKHIKKLMEKLRPEAEGTTAVILGFVMTFMGLFGLWNGYYIFYERMKCIDRAKLEVKYFHTVFGPTFFAIGLLILLTMNFVL